MQSIRGATDLRRHEVLVVATARSQRGAMVAWIVAGTGVMVLVALALAGAMSRFPGGADAFAASILPGAEALRPLRWPAERLDTLGGYLTYHNLIPLSFFLALYAAIVGTRVIRRAEERSVMEQVLAGGLSRTAVVCDVSIGFAGVLAVVSAGLGLGVALALAVSGESNVAGALISVAAMGLCAMVAYGLGLVVSQFTRRSHDAAGIAGLILVVLYLLSTTLDPEDPVGFLAWFSPFWWANKSRALVPGHGADPLAMMVLAVSAAALVACAAFLFSHRDYQEPAWRWLPAGGARRRARVTRLTDWSLSSVWSAALMRSPLGLAAWMLSAASLTSLMVGLGPTVLRTWESFGFSGLLDGYRTPSDQYMLFTVELAGPIVAAYATVQAVGWVGDAQEGRLDMLLSTPLSTTRLVVERAVAVGVGALAVSLSGLGGLAVSASIIGVPFSWAGLGRTLVMSVALALAVAGVAALLVAWLRSGAAVVAMGAILAAMYLLDFLVVTVGWPAQLNWVDFFWAYGHPYLRWPNEAQIAILALSALACTWAACVVMAPRCRISAVFDWGD